MNGKIDRAEVLRYLGHRGQAIPQETLADIERAMDDCLALARPLWRWRIFDLRQEAGGIAVAGSALVLPGAGIAKHLQGCKQAALMAATLGAELDRELVRRHSRNISGALLLDAAASALIEQVCDEAEREIRAEAAGRGLCAGTRFSPGYGDLPLDIQPLLLGVLETEKRMGLTCTQALIMTPRKSVTAIVGLGRERRSPGEKCATCPMRESCAFRSGETA